MEAELYLEVRLVMVMDLRKKGQRRGWKSRVLSGLGKSLVTLAYDERILRLRRVDLVNPLPRSWKLKLTNIDFR